MAQAKKKSGAKSGTRAKKNKSASKAPKEPPKTQTKESSFFAYEIAGILLIATGIFLFCAVQFGAAGMVGTALGSFLKGVFGVFGLAVPWFMVIIGVLVFLNRIVKSSLKTSILIFVMLLMLCIIDSGKYIPSAGGELDFAEFYMQGRELSGGGLFGMSAGTLLVNATGKAGLYIFSVAALLVCAVIAGNKPVSVFIENKYNAAKERKAEREAEEALAAELPEPEQMRISGIYDDGNDAPAFGKKNSIREHVPFSRKKKESNVMKLMQDDTLFGAEPEARPFSEPVAEPSAAAVSEPETGKKKKKKGFGLSGNRETADYGSGYGLDGGGTGVGAAGAGAAGGYGLEERADYGSGFGLDGVAVVSGGYGLDGSSSPEPAKSEAGKGLEETDGVIVKEPEKKLTKKEAASITLDPSEINQNGDAPAVYVKPSIDLLNKPKVKDNSNLATDLKMKAAKLEETLRNFNVDARVVQVSQGPAVTRYEIQPNIGVKVSSIVRLADDIALNLAAKSIRIEAPIPGKAAVGIEVENNKISMVTLREIIDSKEFKQAKSKITFAVGKDISGNAIVADLKTMPHLLIAGSTGSGKSVCINSIITSILYKADPDEVKFVLIDPKVVELGNYNGIPHLLIPVVTEPTKAAAALNWAVAEMTDRYKKFAENHVRDLESFNDYVRNNDRADEVMPQIVIIIDELADLMMAAPSQVEESICRLAQMARAAGMHLIVATQRPSVDIITGVIKANIPSRIAFAVSSQFDSRTILDMAGAEKLVGKGDMLFHPLGIGKAVRVQGTFVSDSEVYNVIEHVKSQVQEAEYSGDVINTIEKCNLPQSKEDADELLPDAIECVVTAGQASVSMLQRRFRIGYNRAARIVDMMEARGIVGPQDGSRPRQVLMSEEEFNQMKEEVESE